MTAATAKMSVAVLAALQTLQIMCLNKHELGGNGDLRAM